MSQITVEHLTVYYGKRCAIWDITCAFLSGKMTAIVGPNGAGKSTLLKALLGFVPIASGLIDRKEIEIAYVPQKKEIDLDFPITVFEVVLMGCYKRLSFFKWIGSKEKQKALAVMKSLNIEHLKHTQISELSGGQLQRVIVARALLQEADFYILDEPFTGIDFATENDLIALFRQLKQEGKGVVLVHHDLTTVSSYFDEVILVSSRLVAGGPIAQVFTEENIKKTYGERSTLLEEVGNLFQKTESGDLS